MKSTQRLISVGVLVLLAALAARGQKPSGDGAAPEVFVGRAERVALSPPLRELAGRTRRTSPDTGAARELPLRRLPRAEAGASGRAAPAVRDPVLQAARAPAAMPAPLITFEGVGNLDGVLPPDTNGDVGPDHYLCMVNMHFCVYDKATGNPLIAPTLMSELFAAAGFPAPASTTDDGDPIVLYDHLADRWFISQFIVSVNPCREVIGISQTGDPTGAWYLYDFVMPNTKMNDYPKFGVWPDGYYMTDNQFNLNNTWGGAGVFVFDRARMLVGDPSATYQYFDLAAANINYGGLLPADLDGPLPPEGTPNYFAMMDDDAWGMSPVDTLYLWEFHVDWANPANTTFGLNLHPNYTNEVAPFDSAFAGGRNNIPQPGTSQRLDVLSDRLMHRLQYRNFGGHESLAVCHTVDVNGSDHAGVRYYELRQDLPAGGGFYVQEQATFAPDSDHRWMGSAALDAYGNLAVGYSVSGPTTYPSIRYAGRMVNDPTGGLFQGEAELWAGAGSQTHSAARWGDYSMMAVDPVDGVTFWYINQYLPVTSSAGWQTRIGSFRMGSPETGVLRGSVTNLLTGAGLTGARVFTTNGYAATTQPGGGYALNLPTGAHHVAAMANGFYTSAFVQVDIVLNETNAQDFGLAPIPLRITPGTGLNAAGAEGGPFAPASQTYLLSNASLAALTWTSAWTQTWVTMTPRGGDLAAGETVNAVVSFSTEAAFLSPGDYADTVSFSNRTDGRVETRAVNLAVAPYLQLISCEGFDAGLPAGWTVLDNAGGGATWRFDDPGAAGNLTGGEGLFAIADSDYEGEVDMDTELRGPALDFSGYDSLACRFKTDFLAYSGYELAEVDVSLNGAAGPWSNLWSRSASLRGPRTVDLDLTDTAAGQANVMLRFHYYNAYYDWWWQVDDVCFWGAAAAGAGDLGVQPPAGLEAEGYYQGPFAPVRVYRLTNSSAAALSWTASCSAAWFETAPAGGSLGAGGALTMTTRVSAAANALPPGQYAGVLTFSNTTQGAASTRPLDLTVLEPLAVQPAAGFTAAGLEGGPFTPDDQPYTLSNPSAQGVAWTATWSAAWIEVAPAGGTIAALSTQQVVVGLNDALLTTPGLYTDTVVFSNRATHTAFARAVTALVNEITGEIAVYDSVAPTNDLLIPFGTVTAGAPRVEHVTVKNTDDVSGGRNLTVSDIFFGFYAESFDSGTARNWKPDVPAHWAVVGGEYRAETAAADFMTTVYTGGQTWADASVEVDVRRSGDPYNGVGLAFRASTDLDADGPGRAYLFLIASNSYSVWRQDNSSYVALQGWTLTTTLKGGPGATNQLLVSMTGGQMRFYANGTLTWTGSDATFASGTIALLAYSEPGVETTAFFDNVRVGLPRTEVVGLGRKTRYLNAFPLADSLPRGLPRTGKKHAAPAAPLAPDEPAAPASLDDPFVLSNLPAFPAVLTPGQSFTFDVTYAPEGVGSNVNVITIQNNDNDDPWVRVDVNGRAAAGVLTGRVTASHSGGPIAGAIVTADNGVTNHAAATDTNGVYRLDLLIGTWDVAATAANYTTGRVSGLVLSDAAATAQDFVLDGSLLTLGPTSIVETLNWGARATNTLCLTNSGPLNLDVQLRARRRSSGASPVPVPPSGGNFPRGDGEPTPGRVSSALKPVDSNEPILADPARVLCYGIDMLNQRLVSFHSDAPGTFTVIGATGANLIPGVDFLQGDFSFLYGLDYNANQLIRIDTATAARTIVGAAAPAAGQSWVGLAGDPDGTLYAASTDITASRLYRIDPASGAVTPIGEVTGAPGLIAIAINGDGEMYGLDIVNDNLIHINKTTGAGTVVGSVGFDANYAQGMDFDDDTDTLYLAAYNNAIPGGELRIADILTGNSVLVGAFQDNTEMNIAVASGGAVPWVLLETNSVAVPAGGSACLEVVFDSAAAPNAASTNLARLALAGNFVNEATPVDLTMIVIPDALTIAPAAAQETSGFEGGPFAPDRILYVLTNSGGAALNWTVSHDAAWLDVAPTSGMLAAEGFVTVTAAVNAAALSLAVGSYTDVLAFVNQSSGIGMPRTVVLTVKPETPDYFTQLFTNDNDLDNWMLTFTPDGSPSFYGACGTNIAAFPTDPTGSAALTLTDDSFVQVNLVGGASVQWYGVSYTNLFVGSNGYITFGSGDTDYGEALADHFNRPRVSGLFDDLNPASGGTVSWTQTADRVVVTFQDIREYGQSTLNNFQFELFFDGTLRVAWLGISALDGLAGLSRGLGLPADFAMSDLSGYGPCGPPAEVTVAATAGAHGTIFPAGAVVVPYGSDTNFLVQANTYFHVADILTNGHSIGHAFGTATTNYLFWWSNIVANGTVHAKIGANLAPLGTPEWWLASHGWTQNFAAAELLDADGDTYFNDEEFRADTIPTNAASYPRLQRVARNLLQFPASTGRVYDVQAGANLSAQDWFDLATNRPGTGAVMSIVITNLDPRLLYRFRVDLPPTP